MTQLEDKLLSIIGKFPTYMRPPYFSYNSVTLSTMVTLGYHVIDANIDTKDYENTGSTYEVAIKNFQDGLNAQGTITLMHDVHQTTVQKIVPRVLAILAASGKTGKCSLYVACNDFLR